MITANGCKSNLANVKCRVSQGSILEPLFFLIYINNLHVAMKYSEVHPFLDDTNLLNLYLCVNSINKQVKYDLKNLSNWLKGSEISLNVGETELALFL